MSQNLTPLMQQYWDIKNAHPDKILFFRMGDFFEIFHQDAEIAAPILNIALTQRNKKSEDYTPMCGMPHHSVATPISKLLQAGYKVALCDQIEDPKLAKGLVKRAITRIFSPGMVLDPDSLEGTQPHYLCAYDSRSLSFLDTTTSEAFYYEYKDEDQFYKLLDIISPKELILGSEQIQVWSHKKNSFPDLAQTEFEDLALCPLSWEHEEESRRRLLAYLIYMKSDSLLDAFAGFEKRDLQKKLQMSPVVIRHLEIFKNYRGGSEGTLFETINKCKTSAGARKLRSWLQIPLADSTKIEHRQKFVTRWASDAKTLKEVRSIMNSVGDLERRLGKLSGPSATPADVLSLADSLQMGLLLVPLASEMNFSAADLKVAEPLEQNIRRILRPEAGHQIKQGGFINSGFNVSLDELVMYAEDSQKMLLQMEAREKESTGISSLKIRYNNVFGYYIEVTNTHLSKVPDHYKRKQTLANAERYLTQELQELEEKVLSARSKRIEMEQAIFQDLIEDIKKQIPALLRLSHKWAELDVYCSLAWLALENSYVCPQFNENHNLKIEGSRHPVVEKSLKSGAFISNDIELRPGGCLLLTGPNMAGKSTLMRQVALTVLLAQMGSYVPAHFANLPVYDQLFTRIGASDFLTEGLSTFMVEMKESAEMLARANVNSLVILDEVGRGTSTYDGMSLAQAILEHLVESVKSHTFFATHYHELTQLSVCYSHVVNAHMRVREKNGDIQFLHTLALGPANKSYGIQVARLAGLPQAVTQRAAKVLASLEKKRVALGHEAIEESEQLPLLLNLVDNPDESKWEDVADRAQKSQQQMELFKEIGSVSISNLTPLEALNHIDKWQRKISDSKLN